jgi:hypothetical protein
MLMTKERLPAIRTLHGWAAISVLQDAGAIRECEDHGWMRDRADPHARERAFAIAREEPPPGVSSEAAAVAVAVAEVLDGIGDACPECEIPPFRNEETGKSNVEFQSFLAPPKEVWRGPKRWGRASQRRPAAISLRWRSSLAGEIGLDQYGLDNTYNVYRTLFCA